MIFPYFSIFYKYKKEIFQINYRYLKNTKKSFYRFFLIIYSLVLLPFSIITILIFKIKKRSSRSKIKYKISRISERYFGHHALESAISSAIQSAEGQNTVLVSIKEKNVNGNKNLKRLVSNSFELNKDYKLKLLEHIYYHSLSHYKSIMNNFYQPMIPKSSKLREIFYWSYLESNKEFKWRSNALKKIQNNNYSTKSKNNIVIALRSDHYHKNTKHVKKQNYRNADLDDLVYLIKTCLEEFIDVEIICYCSLEIKASLSKIFSGTQNLKLISQEMIDILDILNPNSLLINNGNGIGAAAFAIGIKTMIIQHSPWQAWYSSFSNCLMLPIEYKLLGTHNRLLLDEIFKLAFYPAEDIPWDYEKDFLSANIILQRIKDIDLHILKSSLREAFSMDINNNVKEKGKYLNCSFEYSSRLEKNFWKKYISLTPKRLRSCHKKITMSVSSSFLESFQN